MALEALQKMSSRGKGGSTVLLGESIAGFALILERDLTGLKWRKWKEKFDLAKLLDLVMVLTGRRKEREAKDDFVVLIGELVDGGVLTHANRG